MEREHERLREEETQTAAPPDGSDPGRDLGAVRAEADRLLRAADEAIARALSTDSYAFLRANLQTGGQ